MVEVRSPLSLELFLCGHSPRIEANRNEVEECDEVERDARSHRSYK